MTTSPHCPGNCPACFYCETPLATRHEHDHFPLPKRAGGEATVPTCLNCHDLKDRMLLANWPTHVLWPAMAQAGPLGRIFLAKLAALMADIEMERAA
jgi:hypothetical protein